MVNLNKELYYMAKGKHSDSRKKQLLLTLSGVVILIVVVWGVIDMVRMHRAANQSQAQERAYNNDKKSAVINNGGTPVTGGTKGSTPSATYTPPTDNSGISITPKTSGSSVIIGTRLIGYSDGTCSLTVTNGAKTNTQTASIIYAPDYSTCAGFSVPKSALDAGIWNITISVSSGGNTTSKTTVYEVSP